MKSKIMELERLRDIVQSLKRKGLKIVATSGCFDIIHAGHVMYLEESAAKGDVFILFLNSDESVRRLKGRARPIISQDERAIVVAGLGCVDYVCIFDEDTPCQMINAIQPDCFVKGGDYYGKHIPEEDCVAQYGGRVEYVCMVEGCSTTNILNKIIADMQEEKRWE